MSLDTSFNNGNIGANNSVMCSVILNGEKILIGGSFTAYNSGSRRNLVQLSSNGIPDISFNHNAGAQTPGGESWIGTLAVQPDGKIIVGGSFTTFWGINKVNIARVTSTGALDTKFNPVLPLESVVHALALQSTGKILVGGNSIKRLLANGNTDTGFTPPVLAEVRSIKVLSNDKIIVAGRFKIGVYEDIIRLNANGTIDTTFITDVLPNAGNGHVYKCLAIQPDGKIIVGGNFWKIGNESRMDVARLHATGGLDTSFEPGLGFWAPDNHGTNSSYLNAVAIDSNNRLVAGGSFVKYDGADVNNITRIDLSTNIIGRPANASGVEVTDAKGVFIYPNPASDYITVSSSEIEIDGIKIYNLIGQLVKSQKAVKGENTILLQQFSSGVYILKILDKGQVIKSERIIKK